MCVLPISMVDITLCVMFFFFQAEDGIRDLVRSRGLGDVYKRQMLHRVHMAFVAKILETGFCARLLAQNIGVERHNGCLLYTSDAADERSSVDLGGRRIIKKKKKERQTGRGEQKLSTRHNDQYAHL